MYHFFGQFHPVLVHFPVALLIVASFCKLLYIWRPREVFLQVMTFNLHLGALSAIVATFCGWCLAKTEGVTPDLVGTLFWHRWLGTATSVIALLMLLLFYWRKQSANNEVSGRWFFRLGLLALAVFVGATGHLGGALVYGSDWFNFSLR